METETTRTNAPTLGENEAAAWLGDCTSQTLRKWRHRKTGPPYFKVGGRIRYSIEDLQAWLAARRVDPQKESRTNRRRRRAA